MHLFHYVHAVCVHALRLRGIARLKHVAYTAGFFAVATLSSCRDLPTTPLLAPTPNAPRQNYFSDLSGFGSLNSPATGTWSGMLDESDGSSPAGPTPIGVFNLPTFIEVTLTGSVQEVPGPAPFGNGHWGPTGRANHDASVGIIFTSAVGGSTWWPRNVPDSDAPAIDTVRFDGGISIFGIRAAAQAQPIGDATHCGTGGYALCRTWTGSAGISFRRLDAKLTLTRTPGGVVDAGSQVTFTAGADPSAINGTPIPISKVRWKWRSIYPSAGDTVTGCAIDVNPCTRVMQTPGRMFVSAYVNGVEQEKEVQVRVNRSGRPVCNIPGAPEISNFVMDSVMNDLWESSNYSPSTPDSLRREQGGFIIRTINGADTTYGFKKFTYSGTKPCSVRPDATVPAGAVAWIHTHPWKLQEPQESCDHLRIPTTTGFINRALNYNGEASDDDNDVAEMFGAALAPPLTDGLPGYILDVDGINKFNRHKVPGVRFNRCSF